MCIKSFCFRQTLRRTTRKDNGGACVEDVQAFYNNGCLQIKAQIDTFPF